MDHQGRSGLRRARPAARGALVRPAGKGATGGPGGHVERRLTATIDLGGALGWIDGLLTDLGLPYQVVGGLAVRAFGGSRPLVDIDLYVPDPGLEAIATRASSQLVRAPRRHVDEHWDLTFLELGFGGWSIEIAGADTARVRDGRVEDWRPAGIRFEASEMIEVEGVLLPIMPVAQLVDYKAGLGREVDRLDLGELAPIVTDGTETQEATRHGP